MNPQDTTLANYWGWHFQRVLDDLQFSVEPEIDDLSKQLNGLSPDRLELFRRWWAIETPGTKRLAQTDSTHFWCRWAFFDERPATKKQLERLKIWRTQEPDKAMAITFLNHLSEIKGRLSLGTQEHIERLETKFFEPATHAQDVAFLEDWRALYLQTPTSGTILHHLWKYTQSLHLNGEKPSAFLVRLRTGGADFPPFDFLPLWPRHSNSVAESWQTPLHDWQSVKEQAQIRILGDDGDFAGSASEFFQKQLFPCFYLADLGPRASTPGIVKKLAIKYFLFLPVYMDRENESRQWLGVLQVRFKHRGREHLDKRVKASTILRKRLVPLGRIVQMLANDLIVSHVQEAFDRPLSSLNLTAQTKNHALRLRDMLGIDERLDVSMRPRRAQLERMAVAARLDLTERAREFNLHALQHGLKKGSTDFLDTICALTNDGRNLWENNASARTMLESLWLTAIGITGPLDVIESDGRKEFADATTFAGFFDIPLEGRLLCYDDCAKVAGKAFEFPKAFPNAWNDIAQCPLGVSKYLIVGVSDILFLNAVRHSKCTRIRIRACRNTGATKDGNKSRRYRSGDASIFIEDDGVGIKSQDLVFLKDSDVSPQLSPKGGFGLKAARRALKRNGLDLRLASNRADGDEWTSFQIIIPVWKQIDNNTEILPYENINR